MTNSPPSNVNLDPPARVLASGLDSLRLGVDVRWSSESTFERLADLKARAKASADDEPAELEVTGDGASWVFAVKRHGVDGYEWILVGREFAFRIGAWSEPQQRPSVMVEIRSETLWMHSPDGALQRMCIILETLGAEIVVVKPSRTDLCVDLLLPTNRWHIGLIDQIVTRARDITPHYQHRELTGD